MGGRFVALKRNYVSKTNVIPGECPQTSKGPCELALDRVGDVSLEPRATGVPRLHRGDIP
ncbi:hypothetical protein MSZK_05210 [Mycobacterium sp. shizuoka-1]|nr:hypothetical protein MSZK_05210 [Mycobacterium sp. shizuoka-1]